MATSELVALLSDREDQTPPGRIVRALSERGTLSASQIANVTGLAKSTVSTTLNALRKSGIVVEGGSLENGRSIGAGRPATALTLNPRAGTCIGIGIGLFHIQLIVADLAHTILSDQSRTLAADYTPEEALATIEALLVESYADPQLSRDAVLGVGVAIAGPVNPQDGRILRGGGLPTWAGLDIRQLVEPLFDCPIFADNESNCAAIAEMMWGSAQGHEDFVLFKLDLGVGGAIVSHGRVITGVAGAAGEFGHMSIDPEGDLCRCGNRGCLELTASFVRPLEMASRRFGYALQIADVIARAQGGDVGCRRLIEDTAEAAGRGLGIICATVNPGLIVIGGSMARAGDMLLGPLAASYEKHALVKSTDVPGVARTRIVAGTFARSDACLGAVGLVLRHHNRLG
ncbi:ROK family transcriptional regulator [Arsenicitalea aurantiaca]|nr:ROK family transcriptional regulator [Arsenicitalea aurantiaca]